MISGPLLNVDEEIILRLPNIEDAEIVFRAIDENRESLRVWLPFVDYARSREDSKNFLKSIPESGETVFLIFYRDIFAGLIGFKSPDHSNGKVEIGYWIMPSCEGKGVVTRCCRYLITYAFEEMRMNRILIQVAVENKKSRKIPERLGFKEEGIERDGELLVSGYTDIVRYGLLKKEFYGDNQIS